MKDKQNLKKVYNEILAKSYDWELKHRIENVMKHPGIDDWVKGMIDEGNSGILDDLANGRNPMRHAGSLGEILNGYYFKEKIFGGEYLEAHRVLSILANEAANYRALCCYLNFCEKN